jgi:hypothetical protein
MDNPEKLASFGTSCVPNVVSFSGLSILDCPSVLIVFVLCLVYPMLSVSLDCPFLIALSFDCLRPVSCVPNVASFSGLSILDFPLVFLVFILCLLYQMLPVSLDCPFFIALSVVCLHPVSAKIGTQDTG